MAIAKFGALVVGVRGTIAGCTYTANKSGPYLKSWSKGANVRSTRQTDTRGSISAFAAKWRTIDAGARADWDLWAADPNQILTNPLGETYYISGFLWWVKMSQWLAAVDRDPIQSAPLLPVSASPTINSLVVSAGAATSEITYDLGEFSPDYDCIINLAIGGSTGAAAIPITPLLLKGAQTPAGTSLSFDTELTDRYGLLAVGQRAFARITRQTLEGYRSAPSSINANVIA